MWRWKLMLWVPVEMVTNVMGLPQGWERIVRDSYGNVAVLDCYDALAATKICFETAEGCLL